MEAVIYKWTNNQNNKVYIGKSFNKECRYNWFLDFDIHYAGPHIDNARKKYNDIKYWNYEILYTKEGKDRKKLNEIINDKEKYFIELYKSNNKNLGYNISSGGTWGDTYYSLSEEEKQYRKSKFHNTHIEKKYRWMYKDDECKKIQKDKQQEYLDKGWQYGRNKSFRNKISSSLRNSENFKLFCKERRLTEEEIKQREEERKRELEEYHNSQEYKDRIEKWKENSRQMMIKYNKSEKHRQATINSNKIRRKNK